jgi:hypothetical protein
MRYRLLLLLCMVVVVLEVATGLPALGAADAEKPPGDLSGVVIDAAGAPVPGCTVWLLRMDWDVANEVAQTTTDANGRFALPALPPDASNRTIIYPRVFARDSNGRLGAHAVPALSPGTQPGTRPEIRIELMETQDLHGCLRETSGKPIAKATIVPRYFNIEASSRGIVSQIFPAPSVAKSMAAESATDGSFTMHGLPRGSRLMAAVSAPGYGPLRAYCDVSKPAELELPPTGSVRVTVAGVKESEVRPGMELSLVSSATPGGRLPDGSIFYSHQGLTAADGTITFAQVPSGKCTLRLLPSKEISYYQESPLEFELKPGETANVSVPLQPAIVLQGKVIDKQTKAGVEGVPVIVDVRRNYTYLWHRQTTTDAQGKFQVHARPGTASVELREIPPRYLSTSRAVSGYSSRFLEAEVTKDTLLPTIELEPAEGIEGIVVDDAGHPVAGAEVRYTDFQEIRGLGYPDLLRSDEVGKFMIRELLAKPISIRVRSDKAIADPVNVKPGEVKDPVRIVVSEKSAFAVCGTAVDDAGRPVPGAEIRLTTYWSYGRGAMGFFLTPCTSDPQGKFRLGGLWPGDRYNLDLSVPGHDKGASPEVTGSAGETHDFGNLLLRRIGGRVEGSVVDSAGKPIAGARVFNWGDASEPQEATSDAAGRFRLAGFYFGPAYVFAEKDGFRFTRLRTTADATGVTVTMLRSDEPPPEGPRPRSMPSPEEQQCARQLLEKLWVSGKRKEAPSMIAYMMRIDPEQARKWSAEAGGKYDKMIGRIQATKLAETDLDEAIGLVTQDEKTAYSRLKELADHLAARDPAKARRVAEEAVLRARTMEPPWNTAALADVGVLLMGIGDKEAAKKLIDEATELAAKQANMESADYSVNKVIEALASYDLDRALGLADKMGDRDHKRARAKAAAAAPLNEADRALASLKDVEPWYADRARFRLAYRLAATRPDDAMRIVDGMSASHAYGFPQETRAQAFRWMAAAVAPHDKARAGRLIDQAFAIYLSPSEGEYSDNRRATQAAALAVVAAEIGYPDMESVVSRVLASRVTTKHASNAAVVVESSAAMAVLLALVDPATAAEILVALEPQSDLVGSGYSGVPKDVWLKAWTLADPQHAMQLADRELAKVKEQRDGDLWRSGLLQVVDLWTAPAGERFRKVAGHLHNLSFPGEEL